MAKYNDWDEEYDDYSSFQKLPKKFKNTKAPVKKNPNKKERKQRQIQRELKQE